ncbi:hypothetical protein [Photobacterium gaetbulicola]|uniref:hypothetical protein n=1 Tax=Photobacterium gaetbulicola TaxID=1295392 RepID=UPI000A4B33AF|nr:hypothetical protein [Photobacterium gaetbulicola]
MTGIKATWEVNILSPKCEKNNNLPVLMLIAIPLLDSQGASSLIPAVSALKKAVKL